jgi:hypothetical protein
MFDKGAVAADEHHQQAGALAKVARVMVSPETTSGSEKSGAGVPRDSMVDSTITIGLASSFVYQRGLFLSYRVAPPGPKMKNR